MSISLTKGQKISLSKEGGGSLTKILVGAGWDPANESEEIDLDLSCLMIGEDRSIVDLVYSNLLPGGSLTSKDGSILHSGDNLDGEGDGDDESCNIDLTRVAPNVKHLVFTLGSYSGQAFSTIANAFCRVVDSSTNKELARFDVSSGGGASKGLVIARVYRHNGEWKMAAIGEYHANGRTANDFKEISARLC